MENNYNIAREKVVMPSKHITEYSHTVYSGFQTQRIQYALATAEQAARKSIATTKCHKNLLLTVIKKFEQQVKSSEITIQEGKSKTIDTALVPFALKYNEIRAMLDEFVEKSAASLTNSYENLERDARFVTIMLFGRTRAGKSTTMEALTGGDGASIGKGKQHTTTEVKAYYFPASPNGSEPDYPCLRIVDTPGIEGFKGENLAIMAEEFVERSDHIFFLLTDDKAGSGELEQFGSIRTQGKGITVLLNVKTMEEDLDLLVSNPSLVFKEEELEGHKSRIIGYLQEHFNMPPPAIIPFHARSAWLARSSNDWQIEQISRESLEAASGIHAVEEHILHYIHEQALVTRICTPRNLLSSYVWTLKDELRPFAGNFKKMMTDLNESTRRLERGIETARRSIVARYPLLHARFQSACNDIPKFLDETMLSGKFGHVLNKKWEAHLQSHGVPDSVAWFTESGQQDIECEVSEEVRIAAIDFSVSHIDALAELFDNYHEKEERAKNNKYGRAALKTTASVGASALATWAIANWWNPSGWAAAGAVAIVGVVGLAAESAAGKVTDELALKSKRELSAYYDEIKEKLQRSIWADYSVAKDRCDQWLEQVKTLYIETAKGIMRPAQNAATSLWSASVSTLNALDDIVAKSDHEMITDIAALFVTDIASGRITVKKVARYPNVMTKVMLDTEDAQLNVLGLCIGANGRKIRQIVSALDGEIIHLVDAKANPGTMVWQALGFKKMDKGTITFDTPRNPTTVKITVPKELMGKTIGVGGSNIRLASHLLGIKIYVEEEL